jgi:beta-lactamase superfamily II metal-dependent hydrolase
MHTTAARVLSFLRHDCSRRIRAAIVATAAALFLLALTLSTARVAAQAQQNTPRKTLDVYVIDVEGGNATLFVAPTGESLLMDTGNVAPGAVRDAGRIMAAIHDAGLTQIDHLIITHWHGDHFGGLSELAPQIPIREFIDHGPNMQPAPAADEFSQKTYPQIIASQHAKHTVAKPGDRIRLGAVEITVVTSAGQVIKTPPEGSLGGGKANPYCSEFKSGEANLEDPQSIGIFLAFGKFRAAHFGDITKNKEFDLMCPNNPIGSIDVLLGLHHGQSSSNSPVIVHALHPRVAIMNDGTRKGGEPETMQTVHSSPGLEDLWQLHFSLLSGQEYTQPGMFIANTVDDPQPAMPIAPLAAPAPGPGAPPPPAHNGTAYWIKLSAQPDGTFTVTNPRNNFSKTYRPGNQR